ncbi:MAG TPA: PEP-CTERM sorting domain-containing protein [Rhizomicrobium sp.]|nr:PEP-CTERM sorting domain-containing protein [Rhizomicrobium sp.]
MKRLGWIAAAAAALALFSAPASANEIFTLTGATLQDQYGIASGSMTGSITLDSSFNVVSFNFQTPAEPSGGGFSFSADNYTYPSGTATETGSVTPGGTLTISNAIGRIIFDFFTVSTSGLTYYTPSYSLEYQSSAGNRLITAGSFVPAAATVPEPATWTILLGALAMLGLGMLWRSKSSEPRALVG